MRIKEQFQYIKLNIATPMDKAPMVVAPSLPATRPAMNVEAIPIKGTVMLDMMLGIAMRRISLFISNIILGYKGSYILQFSFFFMA
jgi:hypothetical protein